MNLSDLEARRKELEQSIQLCAAKCQHHTAEAAKYERELAMAQGRLDENARHIHQAAMAQMPAKPAGNPSAARKTSRPSAYQRFRSEGPTVVIVRLLYEHREGLSIFEMQARTGSALRTRQIKKVVDRLRESGCARDQGDKLVFTDVGIRLWEGSPLFRHVNQEGQPQAGQRRNNIMRLARGGTMSES